VTTRAVPLARRVLAEVVGTGLLVTVVVGSGTMAARLSPGDLGVQLLANSIATALGLAVLILLVGPVSGAHLNPAVSLTDWALGHRHGQGVALGGRDLAAYIPAQIAGGIGGAILANVMFDLPAASASHTDRSAGHLWLGEIVATSGLISLIFVLVRTGRLRLVPPAVGAYIGAAYWFTSSTSFANPAVTIGRAFTDTATGIAPSSVPGFLVAQLVGAALGAGLVLALYPRPATGTDDRLQPAPGHSDSSWTSGSV
jgi:glycerol uptake facilitator-like aquaporin